MIGRMLIERRKSKTVKMFDQEYLIRTAHNCDVHIDTGTYRFDIQIFRVYDDTRKAYWYCWAELRSVGCRRRSLGTASSAASRPADLEVALAASGTGQVDRGDAGLGQPRGLRETLLAALFLMGHEDFSG